MGGVHGDCGGRHGRRCPGGHRHPSLRSGQAWTFTTGDFTQPEVVGTVPERESREGAPPEVIAYFGEDVSTATARFTLVGPMGELEGELTYYHDAFGEPEGPSCFRLACQLGTLPPIDSGFSIGAQAGSHASRSGRSNPRSKICNRKSCDRAGLEMEAPYAWSFEVTEEGGEPRKQPSRPWR